MKNLKNLKGVRELNRENQKSIMGGVNQCSSNSQCSPGRCCIGGGCIRTSNPCIGL